MRSIGTGAPANGKCPAFGWKVVDSSLVRFGIESGRENLEKDYRRGESGLNYRRKGSRSTGEFPGEERALAIAEGGADRAIGGGGCRDD